MVKKFSSFLALICLTFIMALPAFAAEQLDLSQVTESPDIKIIIDGNQGVYSDVPIIINGRTLLPLRAIFTNLGIPNDDEHIQWNAAEKSVTVKKDKKSVYLKVNSTEATIDGTAAALDVPAVIYKDRTYVPARFVSQSFGKKVVWDADTKSVIICNEADFNNIKSVLDKAIAATEAATKFINERQADVSLDDGKFESIRKQTALYQVDKVKDIASGQLSIKVYNNGKISSDSQYQLWYGQDGFYVKTKDSDKWVKADSNIEWTDDLFDPHWILRKSDVINAGLIMSKDSVTGDTILSGHVGLIYAYMGSFENSEFDNFKINKAESKIVIDKSTNYIKLFQTVFEGTLEFNGLELNYRIESKGVNSEINGSFELARPAGIDSTGTAEEYYAEGRKLFDKGSYEDAIVKFDKVLQIDTKYMDAYKGKAVSLYFLGKFDESNITLSQAMAIDRNDLELSVLKARNLVSIDKYGEAIELCNLVLAVDPNYDFAYYIKSSALYQSGKYKEAIEAADKAISIDPAYEDAYLIKLSLLYEMKNYQELLVFGEKAGSLFPKNEDIPWYMADAYMEQYKYEEAIKQYEKVLLINPENDTVMAYMGLQYYYLQNYDKALLWAENALKINSYNNYAQQLKKMAEEAKLPEAQRIVNYVKENYLYFDKVIDFDKKSSDFIAKSEITARDVVQFIDSVSLQDDIFTYVVPDNYYDIMTEEMKANQVSFKDFGDNAYYLKINSFNETVAVDFKNAIDGITGPENKTLIIDLRDNGGGMAAPSNEILDLLLPECVTSYTVDRDGYMYSYYSDGNQIKFKKIIVLVNENSASSAELLTLGLKKYMSSSVVVVGHPTLGKGVGQQVFENKEKKYMIFLVNFYWNVREQNIAGSKITPDILIQGSSDEDYFKEVRNILAK